MSQVDPQAEWMDFYHDSLPSFIKEMGYVPTFEEFRFIVLESDYRMGED